MPEMTLRQKQSLFSRLYFEFGSWIFSHQGWEVTLGESFDKDKMGHMKYSLHYIGLAADINLFVNGYYMEGYSDTFKVTNPVRKIATGPEWTILGNKWKSMHSLCRWGGDFDSKDYNHFSIEHEGRK